MKYFLLGAAFSLQCIANAQFEVPNGNFEVWDLYNTWTLEPLDWETPNDQLIASVRQDSAAYEGELAMRVTVLPGFEGGVPQEASILIPTDVAPDQLQFAVKTNVPEDVEQDRVEVKVEFLSDNELLYDQTWQSFESIIEWEIVTMEFPEIFVDISHVRITVSAGFTSGLFGGSWDTWISVDQMSEMITAVDAYLDQDDFLPWPNPANDFINVPADLSGSAFLTDICGRTVHKTIRQGVLDVSDLVPGFYVVQIGERNLKIVIE